MNDLELLQPCIQTFLEQKHGVSLSPKVAAPVPLGSGCVAKQVCRVEVAYELGGKSWNLAFLFKRTTVHEALALRALAPFANDYALPQLAGFGEDESGPWLVASFIEGQPLGEFRLPSDAVAALARVHTAYPVKTPPPLPRIDAEDWSHHLDFAEQALSQAGWDSARRQLDTLRSREEVVAALRQLPITLLHGDVHPHNIIVSSADGRSYLIDWGNARLGPVGLDLANCIDHSESPAWQQYWQQARLLGYHAGTGEQERQLCLGKAYVNLHYLPYAICHVGQGRTTDMLRQACDAAGALG
jgi:aminoglycoside phosphotransferase (APT) family kinase protein